MNKKKDIVYLVIAIVTLISLVMGATYAYFQAQTKNGANSSVDITSGTTDHLVFTTDGNISISASADNFKENGQDLSETATAKAILTANNTTHIANDTYNVYLDITSNNLEYSSYQKESDTKIYLNKAKKEEDITNGVLDTYTPVPELYLKIEGPKSYNKEINTIDITEKRGLITIAEDVPISTTAPEGITTDTWTITITFKNLETNQQLNTGKELKGKIIIQKEKLALSKLLADANKEGEEPILIYHDGQKDYTKETNYALEAEDNSYRYSGASEKVNNYVCFGGECSNNPAEADKYSNLYRIIGIFPTDSSHTTYQMKIIKADATTETETGGTGVVGHNGPYGSTSTYKGKLDLNKVTRYYWNYGAGGTNNNNWGESNLNKVNLNETYLNYIKDKDKDKWYNMIEEHTWITAGNDWVKIGGQNAKNAYTSEIVKPEVGSALPSVAQTYQAKVGLMYVSDYMYGASKKYWIKLGWNTSETNDYRSTINDNWLYMGLSEWTITRRVDSSISVFIVDISGNIQSNIVTDISYAVRPTMYLNSNVKIISGDGTPTNPYKLSV